LLPAAMLGLEMLQFFLILSFPFWTLDCVRVCFDDRDTSGPKVCNSLLLFAVYNVGNGAEVSAFTFFFVSVLFMFILKFNFLQPTINIHKMYRLVLMLSSSSSLMLLPI